MLEECLNLATASFPDTVSGSRSSSPTAPALIVGTIDSIPIAAGGEALHLVIRNATVTALPAKQ